MLYQLSYVGNALGIVSPAFSEGIPPTARLAPLARVASLDGLGIDLRARLPRGRPRSQPLSEATIGKTIGTEMKLTPGRRLALAVMRERYPAYERSAWHQAGPRCTIAGRSFANRSTKPSEAAWSALWHFGHTTSALSTVIGPAFLLSMLPLGHDREGASARRR